MTALEKRVIRAKRKRADRLRRNYQLARRYGYTSEEASLIMNQGKDTIIFNAEREGRNEKRG